MKKIKIWVKINISFWEKLDLVGAGAPAVAQPLVLIHWVC